MFKVETKLKLLNTIETYAGSKDTAFKVLTD